jgi:hypothetical protein
VLTGEVSGDHVPASWSFDAATNMLAVEYVSVPDDSYSLALLSGEGRLEDLAGNALDGEKGWLPIPPEESGDGEAGGDFEIGFEVEARFGEFPAPFVGVPPDASLVYEAVTAGQITQAADCDGYTVELDAGQTLTAIVRGRDSLRPMVTVVGPSDVPLGWDLAAAEGEDAVVRTVPVADPATYLVSVEGLRGSRGAYDLRLILNAAIEGEEYGGVANDAMATAQSIDASFIDLASGARRAAVLGQRPVIASEDFQAGALGPD